MCWAWRERLEGAAVLKRTPSGPWGVHSRDEAVAFLLRPHTMSSVVTKGVLCGGGGLGGVHCRNSRSPSYHLLATAVGSSLNLCIQQSAPL